MAKAFIKLGLRPHRSVAIMGHNAPEWHQGEDDADVRLFQMIIFTILMFIFLMFTILMFSIPINDSQCCGDGSRRNCNRSVSDQHIRLKILFFEN